MRYQRSIPYALIADPRFSDERVPLDGSVDDTKISSSGLSITSITDLQSSLDDKADLDIVVYLDETGHIPLALLPSLAATNTFVVADEAAMLATTADIGDYAVQTEAPNAGFQYVLSALPATDIDNWVRINVASGSVISVNSQTGAITLTASDVGAISPASNEWLKAMTNSAGYSFVSITRDSNNAVSVATIKWPDGSDGTFTTDVASTDFPGAVDAFHVTYIPSSGPTRTVTQAAVTRNSAGAVTAQPNLVVT